MFRRQRLPEILQTASARVLTNSSPNSANSRKVASASMSRHVDSQDRRRCDDSMGTSAWSGMMGCAAERVPQAKAHQTSRIDDVLLFGLTDPGQHLQQPAHVVRDLADQAPGRSAQPSCCDRRPAACFGAATMMFGRQSHQQRTGFPGCRQRPLPDTDRLLSLLPHLR